MLQRIESETRNQEKNSGKVTICDPRLILGRWSLTRSWRGRGRRSWGPCWTLLSTLLDTSSMASGMRSVGTKKLKLKFVKNLPVFWDVIVKNTILRTRLNYTSVSHILLRLPHNFAPCHVFCCPGLDQSTQRDRSQTVEDHFKVKHRL